MTSSKKARYFILSLILLNSAWLSASEITICIIDPKTKNNPKYYHLPNTATKLVCELEKGKRLQTIKSMYSNGWHLLQVVKVSDRYKPPAQIVPSPILYFEK